MDDKKIKRAMAAQAASLSRIGARILNGARLVVKWLLPPSDDLGFTSEGNPTTVNVAWDNESYMGDMTEDEKIFFRMGVFAHETLHQVFTNFRYSNKICNSLSQAEAGIFMRFANTLEDPAIEYFAPQVMGGKLLAALKYSIAVIYKKSPGIEVSSQPFSQMLNALIHFGDCGVVKGHFTFPEAEEYFGKIAPLYNEGITCPDSKKRLDIAKECMEISRPLWEEFVKDEEEWNKLIEELLEFLKKHNVPTMDEDDMGSMPMPSDAKSDARAETLKKSKGEKADKGDKPEDTASGDGDGDDEGEEGEAGSGSGKSADGEDTDETEDADAKSKGKGEDSDKDGSDESSSSDESDNESSSTGNPSSSESSGKESDSMDADEILEDDLIIDDDMMEGIRDELEREEAEIEKAEKKESSSSKASEELPDYEISSQYFKHASVLNRRVKGSAGSLGETYNELVSKYNWEIKNLTKQLAKLFEADKEENVRATSGSYNIKRGTIGCTARIMDKRRDPSNRKDAAVCLCVDLSGSMSYEGRIQNARKASVVLAEALRSLNIPYYIMGFRADSSGCDAVHEHFVTWDGKGRETLAAMQAGSNNFDGYSIRYASNLLKSRPESNKLLFVISDGEPACNKYRGRSDGESDTLQAVKDSRKVCNVFGIAFGSGCTPEVLQRFYGKDFIHCREVDNLSNMLGKKLVKMLK